MSPFEKMVEERLIEIENAQTETTEALAEIMQAIVVLAEAIDGLDPSAQASRESLEAQHQRFKRDAQQG